MGAELFHADERTDGRIFPTVRLTSQHYKTIDTSNKYTHWGQYLCQNVRKDSKIRVFTQGNDFRTLFNLRRERKPTRCNNQMFIINFCLNMFRASLYPSSGEQRPCVTACGVLRWFCWMWLVAVVGRCVVRCEQCSHLTTQCRTPYAVTHGLCSPEDGHNDARNMLRQCW